MIEYVSGKLVEKHPTHSVVDVNGMGYLIHTSILCYEQMGGQEAVKFFIHEIIREDTHELYGFLQEAERKMFRLLISVSGVGANTARVILSGLDPKGLAQAIYNEDVAFFKKVKGVGPKTAQRLIVELKDKVLPVLGEEGISGEIAPLSNTAAQDALTALLNLGFDKKAIAVALKKIESSKGRDLSVEDYIRYALQAL